MTSVPTAVLVPLDGSERAEAALSVACEVVDLVSGRLILASVSARPEDLLGYLNEIAATTGRSGHSAEVIVDDDLLRFLLDDDLDREVIVCRSTGVYRREAYDQSNALRILSGTHRPVVKVGPLVSGDNCFDVRSIVVPTDGSSFAAHAMPLAARWSDLLDVPITLLRVDSPGVVLDLEEERVHRAVAAHPTVATRRSRTSLIEVGEGDPALRILDHAGDEALIVMATHARIGTERLVHGSVTDQVLRHARRPVVSVRADELSD